MKDITAFSGRYSFLSNFSPASVYILIGTKWVKCATVEHGYQASKTLVQHHRQKIIDAPSAHEAKAMGQRVKRSVYWDDVKTIVMLELLRQKFSHSRLRDQLLRTGSVQLIEGNTWHDNFWGSCVCDQCVVHRTIDRHGTHFLGENWLGRLLMRVRKDIR